MIGLANLLVILAVVFGIRSFLYEPFRIPAGSMLPTIEIGDHIVVSKQGYGTYGTFGMTVLDTEPSTAIERGHILVFRFPIDESLIYVKRVVGLPGDVVKVHGNDLYLNDQLVAVETKTNSAGEDEFFQRLDDQRFGINLDPARQMPMTNSWQVPPRHIFVMGDNRPNSNDSRIWGFVPTDNLVGRVRIIF